MYVRALSLNDFRSYADVSLDLTPGVTAFVGSNGTGKTNLVEAVGYLAGLTSHRVAQDAPLVRSGAERAVVRGTVVRDGRDSVIEIEITPGRANRARLNGSPVPRPREVLGVLRTVLFAPEDLAIVKGDPAHRRGFLDELLVARSPRFAAVHSDYERVLKQRNALLKSAGMQRRAGAELPTLDVWDAHLATAGAAVLAGRHELVAALRPLVDKSYSAVSHGGGPARIDYRSDLAEDLAESTDRELLATALLAALAGSRSRELDRGVTLVGPHRDDLLLSLGELPARGYASHGESWSFALALRLAAYDLLCGDGGEPVLILDDVFAELDDLRRRSLADLVAPAEQVLVTAAVAGDVPAQLTGARWDVTAGEVHRVR
ncbi:MAG TPA: DNA replication/repair protein RecF [Mycobacteriales bacterium]|nr:DNA replication/repair protein RecF [Mycobacteriales bacterium]